MTSAMTDNVNVIDKKLATTIEALTALASALSWMQPSDTASASSYLKDAWEAIDKLKEELR